MAETNLKLITGYTGKNDRTPSDDASLNSAIFGTGEYVLNYGNRLKAVQNGTNEVQIMDGVALMQGLQCRILTGSYVAVPIETVVDGMHRGDIIALQYDKVNDIETVKLVAIKGTAVATTEGISYNNGTHGTIETGAILNQMPLYYVAVESTGIASIVSCHTVMPAFSAQSTVYNQYVNTTNIDTTATSLYTGYPHVISLPLNGIQENDMVTACFATAQDKLAVNLSQDIEVGVGYINLYADANDFSDFAIKIQVTRSGRTE